MRLKPSTLVLCCSLLFANIIFAQTSDLIISEYIEGSSYNKAVEIYNGTGSTVDLSSYALALYSNGNTSANTTLALSGTLPDGDVYIVAHSSSDTALLNVADTTSGVVNYNGDDTFVLQKTDVGIIDAIGQIGFDPGSSWSNNGASTVNQTLRRKAAICAGDTDGSDAFDPSIQWVSLAIDTFDGLGAHSTNCGGGSIELVINEIHADPHASAGDANNDGVINTADDEFVEIVNNSASSVDISGWTLSDATSIRHTFPAGSVLAPNHAVIIFGGGSPVGDFGGSLVQIAGSGGVGLNNSGDTVTLNDGMTDQAVANYGSEGSNSESITLDPDLSGAIFIGHSSAIYSNGALFSPGTRINGACFYAVYIHAVQGDGAASPMDGATDVTIEGVVTGDLQLSTQLNGFFLQEEANQNDSNSSTSEGIFIYAETSVADVSVGDHVRITGDIVEYYEKTEMNNVASIVTLGTEAIPSPKVISLPVANIADFEAFEGMLVSINQTLTVTGNSSLVKYGELELSVNGRLFIPTNIVDSGVDANNQQDLNNRSRIQLDDGASSADPNPVPYADADKTRRLGSTLPALTGLLDFSFGDYEIHPTIAITFTDANPRSAAPANVGGPLMVSSFNVLNFFNGDGQGGGFPTSRGADTFDEYLRQRAKIVSAITAINADIFGLIEIENDGFGVNSAIQDLVNAVNQDLGASTYNFINVGVSQVGTDAITNALIYKTTSVTPQGAAAYLDETVDPTFVIGNRPALAQTFKNANNAVFTVVVNHLRSKGSSCSGDPDLGDGQGNCNLTRVNAANAMTNWLASDPTGSTDPDFLIIGDLNAYANEDPVTAIKSAGYVDLVQQHVGAGAYSYVYADQSGYLDHALASTSLNASVTGATIWHINSDEIQNLDYNDTNPSDYYKDGPFRASDHDPVIVGLNLESPVIVELSSFNAQFIDDLLFLIWSTASEINVAGYNILRQHGSSSFEKINETLIPSTGGLRGADYEFCDPTGCVNAQYMLQEIFLDGHTNNYGPINAGQTSLVNECTVPNEFALHSNFPNPFNPSTSLQFDIPSSTNILINIFDINGRLISTLIDGAIEPGMHNITWDGRDQYGNTAAAGLYFCRMVADNFSQSQKLMLVK
jgi:uncharacterized protein